MSRNSGLLFFVLTDLSLLVPFLVGEYFLKYENFPDNRQFASIPSNGQHCFVYDSRYGVNSVTAAGAWIKRWEYWGGRGAELRIDSVAVPSDMLFNCWAEKLPYMALLRATMIRYADL